MTKIAKTYKFVLPLSMDEFSRGQRYTVCKMTNEQVQILHFKRSNEKDKTILESKKELNLGGMLPRIVQKVLPREAYVVEEYSRSVDVIILEDDTKQMLHIHEKSKMQQNDNLIRNEQVINEVEKDGTIKIEKEKLINTKDGELIDKHNCLEEMVGKKKAEELINNHKMNDFSKDDPSHECLSQYKNLYYDEKTFKMSIETKITQKSDYSVGGVEIENVDFRVSDSNLKQYGSEYEKRHPQYVYVYKTLRVEVNKFGLGWIASEVAKGLRNQLAEFQSNIVEWREEWKNFKDEQLEEMENLMVQKYIKRL
jgi:hypothetical protein